ncbi:MAG: hypothetical protein KGI11_02765 [Thaumarchaeota archaeon]|nr:hypothetical protein [Nitrososphaerota archaeon]
MTGLFSKKKTPCAICKKEVSHTHKPKNSWNVNGLLCGNCYVDLMEKYFENDNDDKCTLCGDTPGSFNLWKPKKEWEVTGWLCKPCFDQKEKQDNDLKNFCCLCGAKIGFVSYSPKKEWNMKGSLCKNCWTMKTKT